MRLFYFIVYLNHFYIKKHLKDSKSVALYLEKMRMYYAQNDGNNIINIVLKVKLYTNKKLLVMLSYFLYSIHIL